MATRPTRRSLLIAWVLWALVAAASAQPARSTQLAPDPADPSEVWQQPTDLATRDLFYGPGGRESAPDLNGTFAFISYKKAGSNPGYKVRDSAGRRWSVKLTDEAQPEVFLSRILWAIGFHQPATYFLDHWTLTGQDEGPHKPPARFRLEPPEAKVLGDWSWSDNPFVGTRPLTGLLVAQLIFNNWDLKTVNNKIYGPLDKKSGPGRAYVVRDLGGSLGGSRQPNLAKWLRLRAKQGIKNDVDQFEHQGNFIERVDGDRVHFDYRGLNEGLLRNVTVADVQWVCGWLSKISDRQWHDAFRAAGYDGDVSDRYLRKIREKIDQGLSVSSSTTASK